MVDGLQRVAVAAEEFLVELAPVGVAVGRNGRDLADVVTDAEFVRLVAEATGGVEVGRVGSFVELVEGAHGVPGGEGLAGGVEKDFGEVGFGVGVEDGVGGGALVEVADDFSGAGGHGRLKIGISALTGFGTGH